MTRVVTLNMNWRLFTSIFLFLLFLPSVLSVGFNDFPPPAEREFTHFPGQKISVPLGVTSSLPINVFVNTPTQGNIETKGTPDDDNIMEYVWIEDPAPETGSRDIVLHIEPPDQMKPGLYEIDLYAQDFIKSAGGVQAVAKTKIRFKLWVLDENKLLDVTGHSIPPVAEGMKAEAHVGFVSRTSQDINNVYALITLYDGEEEYTSSESKRVALPSAEKGSVTVELDTQKLQGGEYPAKVMVFYDGNSAEGPDAVLKIGTLHVDVPSYTTVLDYNTTNKFKFNVTNQWNQELQKVYAVARMKNQEKQTASINIPPFGTTEYEVYFDRDESIPPGPVDINLTVFFQDYDVSSGDYVDKVESFLVTPVVKTPEVVEEPMDITIYVLMGVVAVLLILVIIVLFVLLSRRKSNVQKEE